MAKQLNKLYRSSRNRMIAGVCGGVAEYFSIDPTLVRLGYVVLSVFSAAFPGILVYLIAWLIIPADFD
ncbi:MAG: PspC domain-containing protein [Firmicutes bacterium]|nr:PspC domain-containing protein [Bacillota bacterium]